MVEIHEPPNVKVIDGISENEDGKNGRQRLTVERQPHQVLAMRKGSGPGTIGPPSSS
jgi:hypothetical protein